MNTFPILKILGLPGLEPYGKKSLPLNRQVNEIGFLSTKYPLNRIQRVDISEFLNLAKDSFIFHRHYGVITSHLGKSKADLEFHNTARKLYKKASFILGSKIFSDNPKFEEDLTRSIFVTCTQDEQEAMEKLIDSCDLLLVATHQKMQDKLLSALMYASKLNKRIIVFPTVTELEAAGLP